jgi:hypothetical protein
VFAEVRFIALVEKPGWIEYARSIVRAEHFWWSHDSLGANLDLPILYDQLLIINQVLPGSGNAIGMDLMITLN